MEIAKIKKLYDTPSMIVVEVKQEGVICISGNSTLQDYDWSTIPEE